MAVRRRVFRGTLAILAKDEASPQYVRRSHRIFNWLEVEIVDGQGVVAVKLDREIGLCVTVNVKLDDGVGAFGDGAEIALVASEVDIDAEEAGDGVADLGVERVEIDLIDVDLVILDRIPRGSRGPAVFQRLNEQVGVGAAPEFIPARAANQSVEVVIAKQPIVTCKTENMVVMPQLTPCSPPAISSMPVGDPPLRML